METVIFVKVNVPAGLFTYDIGAQKLICTKCKQVESPPIDNSHGMRVRTDFEEIFTAFMRSHSKCLGITVESQS
jgi:hypothetical protein